MKNIHVVFGVDGVLYNPEIHMPYMEVKGAIASISMADNVILSVMGLGKPSYEGIKLDSCDLSQFLTGTILAQESMFNEDMIIGGFMKMFSQIQAGNTVVVGNYQTMAGVHGSKLGCTTVLVDRHFTSPASKYIGPKTTHQIKTLAKLEPILRKMGASFPDRTFLDERNLL